MLYIHFQIKFKLQITFKLSSIIVIMKISVIVHVLTENKLPKAWQYQPFCFHLLHYRDGLVAQESISMCANRAQEWVAAENCVEHLSLRCGEAEVLSQGCAK